MQLHGILLKQLGYSAYINKNEEKKCSLQLALTRVSIKQSSTCDGAIKPTTFGVSRRRISFWIMQLGK